MDKAGVLEKLQEPVWMNALGVIIESVDEAFGMKVTHNVKHPNYMLFVDEVGSNTNMKGNGNIGSKRLLKAKGSQARVLAATTDVHFTVLGFTAGNSEPVMCANVVTSHELRYNVQLGVDIRADMFVVDDQDHLLSNNYGPNKQYPGGPTCNFRGKKVPSFVGYSPKGGITLQLLTNMLARMDALELSPQILDGLVPFLLLDGHHSRMQLLFLEYVNNPEQTLKVSIRLPNGTAKWQVGDSAEQNGAFKVELTSDKRALIQHKIRMGMSITVT